MWYVGLDAVPQVDLADIRYLVREVWKARSIFLFGKTLDSSDASKVGRKATVHPSIHRSID